MATETIVVSPNQFVHPRQSFLWDRLQSGRLPKGAAGLLIEAINEYQVAFGASRPSPGSWKPVDTSMLISLPDQGSNRILAGHDHLLTVQFGREIEPMQPFTTVAVILDLRNLYGAEIYPDQFRYVGIDADGNSRPTRFLLQVPDSLRGHQSAVETNAYSGESLVARAALGFRVV